MNQIYYKLSWKVTDEKGPGLEAISSLGNVYKEFSSDGEEFWCIFVKASDIERAKHYEPKGFVELYKGPGRQKQT